MGVIFQDSYSLPGSDEPLTHARIAHSSNWFAGGTITASGTATGYFADAPDNSLTYEKWQADALPATWQTDLGGAQTVDYCCIAGHTLGTNGCTIKVQYWDGAAWVDMTAATAIADDMPIYCIFAPISAQIWRLNITAGTDEPTIAVIRFGASMQMQRAIYGGHTPIDMARQTILRSNYSETGEFLGRTKQRTQLASAFAWAHLTAAWVRTNWKPFQKAIETEPFFIAWRPADFSEVAYGQVDQIPSPSNMGVRDLMSVDLSMRARGYD